MTKNDMGKIEQEANDVIDSAKDKAQYVKSKAENISSGIFGYIEENPWKVVSIGIIATIIISKILSSKK